MSKGSITKIYCFNKKNKTPTITEFTSVIDLEGVNPLHNIKGEIYGCSC